MKLYELLETNPVHPIVLGLAECHSVESVLELAKNSEEPNLIAAMYAYDALEQSGDGQTILGFESQFDGLAAKENIVLGLDPAVASKLWLTVSLIDGVNSLLDLEDEVDLEAGLPKRQPTLSQAIEVLAGIDPYMFDNAETLPNELTDILNKYVENIAVDTALLPDAKLIVANAVDDYANGRPIAIDSFQEPRFFMNTPTGSVDIVENWREDVATSRADAEAKGLDDPDIVLVEVRPAITHDELDEWGHWVEGTWEETQGKVQVIYLKGEVAATAAEHFETYQKVGPEQWFGSTCLEDTQGLHWLKDGDLVQVVKANPELGLGQEKEYIQVAQANTVDLGR